MKASLVVSPIFRKDQIFDPGFKLNSDGHLRFFHELKREFNQKGISLSTQDINKVSDSEIVIYNDMPRSFPKKIKGQKVFLIALESIAVMPENFDPKKHDYFDKIFTWYDVIVDNKKIFKLNFSSLIDPVPYKRFEEKDKFLCIIAANKYSDHGLELYTERINIIEYLERNPAIQFDLYGYGWDAVYKNRPVYNFIKKLQRPYLRKIFSISEKFLFKIGLRSALTKRYNSYRGSIPQKIDTLSKYKFNICYENVYVPGWITEKIFDCFFAGCVPIYWGASNVLDYIPANTFIDRRKFGSDKELINYLLAINADEYLECQMNISAYLKSKQVKAFSAEFNAALVCGEIMCTVNADLV